jgi:hypothetical protein
VSGFAINGTFLSNYLARLTACLTTRSLPLPARTRQRPDLSPDTRSDLVPFSANKTCQIIRRSTSTGYRVMPSGGLAWPPATPRGRYQMRQMGCPTGRGSKFPTGTSRSSMPGHRHESGRSTRRVVGHGKWLTLIELFGSHRAFVNGRQPRCKHAGGTSPAAGSAR